MDIQRFLKQQNIQRFRRLLNVVSDEVQRRQIINLLKEEESLLEQNERKNAAKLLR